MCVCVVQSRIEDDGGRADDGPVRRPSSTSAPDQGSPSLQYHPLDLRSAALGLLGASPALIPSAATALKEDRCRSVLVEEAVAAEPANFVADLTPLGPFGEAVDLLREDEAVRPYLVEDRPYVSAVVAGLSVPRLGRRDHVG